jgi:hypothetical protein
LIRELAAPDVYVVSSCFKVVSHFAFLLTQKQSEVIMKMTRYFSEQVLRKRTYLDPRWIEQVLQHPTHVEVQDDGRIRHWGYISELGRYLRVVTLEDAETVHNAFPDRNFKGVV